MLCKFSVSVTSMLLIVSLYLLKNTRDRISIGLLRITITALIIIVRITCMLHFAPNHIMPRFPEAHSLTSMCTRFVSFRMDTVSGIVSKNLGYDFNIRLK